MNLNDPQGRFDDFLPEYGHSSTSSFADVLRVLDEKTKSSTEKGRMFEQLVKAFIQEDEKQSSRFDRVWLWSEWPLNGGRPDLGIDLVARESSGGDLVAIQCKFYNSPQSRVQRSEVDKFITEYGRPDFSSGIFVSTTTRWTKNAEEALQNRDKPISHWGPDTFEESSIDWRKFSLAQPRSLTRKVAKDTSVVPKKESRSGNVPLSQEWAQSGGMLITEGSLFQFAGDESASSTPSDGEIK